MFAELYSQCGFVGFNNSFLVIINGLQDEKQVYKIKFYDIELKLRILTGKINH